MKISLLILVCLTIVTSCKIKDISMDDIMSSEAMKRLSGCDDKADVSLKLDTYRICTKKNNASALFHPGSIESGVSISITTEDEKNWIVAANKSLSKVIESNDKKTVTHTFKSIGPSITIKASKDSIDAKDFFITVPVSEKVSDTEKGLVIAGKCKNNAVGFIVRPIMIDPQDNTVNTFAGCLGTYQVLIATPPLDVAEDIDVVYEKK